MPKRELSKCREWERERRERLKTCFDALARLLPSHDPTLTPSKLEILQRAATHITDLQQKNKELLLGDQRSTAVAQRDEVRRLRERVRKLNARTEQLASLMRTAGLKIPKECISRANNSFKGPPRLWSGRLSREKAETIRKEHENDLKNEETAKPKRKRKRLSTPKTSENTPPSVKKPKQASKSPKKCAKKTVSINSASLASKVATVLGPGTLILANGSVVPVPPPSGTLHRIQIVPTVTQNKVILMPNTTTTAVTTSTTSTKLPVLRPKTVGSLKQNLVAAKVAIPPLNKKKTAIKKNKPITKTATTSEPTKKADAAENVSVSEEKSAETNKEIDKPEEIAKELPKETEKSEPVKQPEQFQPPENEITNPKPDNEPDLLHLPENESTNHQDHSELSNDIFASLGGAGDSAAMIGAQHTESMSPTAAFLLAFPLVSTLTGSRISDTTNTAANANNNSGNTGLNSNNNTNNNDRSDEGRQSNTPTTLLQIGGTMNLDNKNSNSSTRVLQISDPINIDKTTSKLDNFDYTYSSQCQQQNRIQYDNKEPLISSVLQVSHACLYEKNSQNNFYNHYSADIQESYNNLQTNNSLQPNHTSNNTHLQINSATNNSMQPTNNNSHTSHATNNHLPNNSLQPGHTSNNNHLQINSASHASSNHLQVNNTSNNNHATNNHLQINNSATNNNVQTSNTSLQANHSSNNNAQANHATSNHLHGSNTSTNNLRSSHATNNSMQTNRLQSNHATNNHLQINSATNNSGQPTNNSIQTSLQASHATNRLPSNHATNNHLQMNNSATNNSVQPTNNSVQTSHATNSLQANHATNNLQASSLQGNHSTSNTNLQTNHATKNSLQASHATNNSLQVNHSTNNLQPSHATSNLQGNRATNNHLQVNSTSNSNIQTNHATNNSMQASHATNNSLQVNHSTNNLQASHATSSLQGNRTTNNHLQVNSTNNTNIQTNHSTNNSMQTSHATNSSLQINHSTNNLQVNSTSNNNHSTNNSIPVNNSNIQTNHATNNSMQTNNSLQINHSTNNLQVNSTSNNNHSTNNSVPVNNTSNNNLQVNNVTTNNLHAKETVKSSPKNRHKSQNQRPPVNWMTTPDPRSSFTSSDSQVPGITSDYFLPPFSDVYSGISTAISSENNEQSWNATNRGVLPTLLGDLALGVNNTAVTTKTTTSSTGSNQYYNPFDITPNQNKESGFLSVSSILVGGKPNKKINNTQKRHKPKSRMCSNDFEGKKYGGGYSAEELISDTQYHGRSNNYLDNSGQFYQPQQQNRQNQGYQRQQQQQQQPFAAAPYPQHGEFTALLSAAVADSYSKTFDSFHVKSAVPNTGYEGYCAGGTHHRAHTSSTGENSDRRRHNRRSGTQSSANVAATTNTGFSELSFLSMSGAISSPILPDDFHASSTFLTNAPPPIPTPVPSSLTNFNLSAIFPEINKGATSSSASTAPAWPHSKPPVSSTRSQTRYQHQNQQINNHEPVHQHRDLPEGGKPSGGYSHPQQLPHDGIFGSTGSFLSHHHQMQNNDVTSAPTNFSFSFAP